jgi:phosphoribosylpyrophosphate synthetase
MVCKSEIGACFPHPPTLPDSAYDQRTLPVADRAGIEVFPRALSIEREFAQCLWMKKEEQLGIKDRNDFGIVVIPSGRRINNRNHPNSKTDVTHALIEKLQEEQLGTVPVAIYSEQPYANDVEARKLLLGETEHIPETVYLVASAVDEKDFSKIRTVAAHLKHVLHVKKVSVILTFMGFGREDKNGSLNDSDEAVYNGKLLTLLGEVVGWGEIIDQVRVYEPHSSFTQAVLAKQGVPCAPISLWKVGVREIEKDKEIDPQNIVVIGPDIGRNKAAKAIGNYFNAPVVGVIKHRDPQTGSIYFDKLTEEQENAIMGENGEGGKDIIMYDDEGASLGTSADIIEGLINSYQPKSISLFLAHRRFTDGYWDSNYVWHDGWNHHLNRILQLSKEKGVRVNIYLTDSREPIGDIESIIEAYNQNIKVIPLVYKVIEDIKLDVEGVDPWDDKRTADTIL